MNAIGMMISEEKQGSLAVFNSIRGKAGGCVRVVVDGGGEGRWRGRRSGSSEREVRY
jgi:hypothetical protein